MLDTCTPSATFASTNPAAVQEPMLEFVSEAVALYRVERKVTSLLSLGSGHFGLTHLIVPNPESIMNNEALERISNSEVSAEIMERRMENIGLYFRFSIEHGMQTNEPGYSDGLESVNAQALSYLEDEEVKRNISWYIYTDDGPDWINLSYLCTSLLMPRNQSCLNIS